MCHAGHHDDHEDDDGAHDDHHHDQEGRCAMLGTEGGPLLRETEMSRDVGEGSSVKPWGSGSANNLVTVYVGMIWHIHMFQAIYTIVSKKGHS